MKKLGRKPRKFNPNVPHMSALRFWRFFLPKIPVSVDYTQKLPADLGMMLNDRLGDCTCAAIYHARQVWSANADKEITETDSLVEQLYHEACGYNPGDSNSDQGGVEQDVLEFLLKTGAPVGAAARDKIFAFVEVDPHHMADVRRTIYDCGVAYIGINVPQSVMDGGDTWDVGGDETILGGHAVILAAYDAEGFTVISWGKRYRMTNAFFQKFTDEVYAIADPAWMLATGKTLLGMTPAQLEEQMNHFKQ